MSLLNDASPCLPRFTAEFGLWSSEGAGAEVELIVPAGIAYADFASQSLWQRVRHVLRRRPDAPILAY
jgi:hypothetical protein